MAAAYLAPARPRIGDQLCDLAISIARDRRGTGTKANARQAPPSTVSGSVFREAFAYVQASDLTAALHDFRSSPASYSVHLSYHIDIRRNRAELRVLPQL